MISFLHHDPCERYRVFYMSKESDTRTPLRLSIHDSCISLNVADKIQS
jgi:hypothetical protein